MKTTSRDRDVLEILEELNTEVLADEDSKSTALLVLGAAISLAVAAGWTLPELAKLRAWPFTFGRKSAQEDSNG